jgi:serine/threonine protein kinase
MSAGPIRIGSVLGGFRVESELGRGGMGVVYGAHELTLNRKVALKVLSQRLCADEEFVERFRREAQVIAALNHPNILNIVTYGEEKGCYYFAMEYVRGKDLSQILKEKPVMPVDEALAIAEQVAGALGEAAKRGVVHRDLKPSNIMVDESGRVLVTDFGVAHLEDSAAQLTRTGWFLGTPEYASPEQASGCRLDVRSDIYSLGAVLYRMLSGRPPVRGESPLKVVVKIATEPVTPIGEVNPSLPWPARDLIGRMMTRDVNKRFQTPSDLLEAIAGCRAQLEADPSPAEERSHTERATPAFVPKRRNRAAHVGGMVGVALAVFLVVWLAEGMLQVKGSKKRIDLRTSTLREASHRISDLQQANLAGCDLAGVNFEGSNLRKANLARARLVGANLTAANLSEANLAEADLTGAILSHADLSKATAPGATFRRATLEGMNGRLGDFSDCDFSQARAGAANFERAALTRTRMERVAAEDAVFEFADLRSARMMDSMFTKASLVGASLENARATSCNFRQADFYCADIKSFETIRCDTRGVRFPETLEVADGHKGANPPKVAPVPLFRQAATPAERAKLIEGAPEEVHSRELYRRK